MTAAPPPRPPAPMSGTAAPSRPSGAKLLGSKLTADARRALALHAGGDLPDAEARAAQSLADDCPHCRGHLAAVRGGLSALAGCDAGDADSGLWPAVRAGLPSVGLAADPPSAPWARRFAAPATALTAAAALAGAYAFGPTGNVDAPGERVLPTRPVGGADGAVRPLWIDPPAAARPLDARDRRDQTDRFRGPRR